MNMNFLLSSALLSSIPFRLRKPWPLLSAGRACVASRPRASQDAYECSPQHLQMARMSKVGYSYRELLKKPKGETIPRACRQFW